MEEESGLGQGEPDSLVARLQAHRHNDNEENDVGTMEVLDNTRGQVRGVTQDTLLHTESLSYDVLCTIAGTNNLGSVRNITIRLRCPGPQDSLRRLPRLMPFLTCLYLDHSIIPNFRVFGEEVPSLKVISVCCCGLTELFGIDFLVNLEEFYAVSNRLTNVTDLSDLLKLKILDMENNDLHSFDSISFLYLCPKLHTVTFRGNPIAEEPDYKERMSRYFPRLKKLDPTPRKYRVIEDACKSNDSGSESPEDEEDFRLKIPDAEDLSDDDMPTDKETEILDEEMYNKFVENDLERGDEDNLFCDIETEESERLMRLGHEEKMLQSPDESFDIPEDTGCDDGTEPVFTSEQLNLEKGETNLGDVVVDKKFCCKKHGLIFTQSKTSIRMCATKQLYEQVSCDEPYVEMEDEDEEQRRILEERSRREEERRREEYLAHEEDIRGKLLDKRRSMDPAKVKEVMLETSEADIEEIAPTALPVVVRRDQAGGSMSSLKSAFTESNFNSETEEEIIQDRETPVRPDSSKSRPSSGTPLFSAGKGRPPSGRPPSTRPRASPALCRATYTSSSSPTSLPYRPSSSSSFSSSTEGTDSGVDINASPLKESVPKLPQVRSKDEMLQKLRNGRKQLGEQGVGERDCRLEEWD